MKYNVLILGASYGSLFGTKLLMAGHRVSLVCTRPTAELINREGTVVRFPIKGRESLLDISSKKLPGTLSATTPDEVDPGKFDLIVLGMQEAQYGSPGVRELMGRVARARKPCLAIMNMPPLPYLKRIPGLRDGNARALLRRSRRLGRVRSRADDAGESRSPGISPAGSAEERSPGGLADQLQGGALRSRGADRSASQSRGRHRSSPVRRRRRPHRNSGEAQGARFPFRAAGQMADADGRQLPLHPAGRHDLRSRTRSTRTSTSPARSTTGCGNSAPAWAPTTPTWFRSRSTPRRPKVLANPLPRRARFLAAPSTSSASIAWSAGSPANKDSSPTRWTRSSHWWTSVLERIVQPSECRSYSDHRSFTTYSNTATPARAHWPSCGLVPPETPIAPTILPSTTIGIPPSTGTAPLIPSTRNPSPPAASVS